MSEAEGRKTELVPSRSAALTCGGAASLVRRGVQDLLATAEAQALYEQGLELWAEANEEQENTGARFMCSPEELESQNIEGYQPAFECFQRGIELDPSHAGLQLWLGESYYFGKGVCRDYVEAARWYLRAAGQEQAGALY